MNLAINVENLSKKYLISHVNSGGPSSIREVLTKAMSRFRRTKIENNFKELQPIEPKTEEFWALRDLSFKVDEGERIAIIGGNGAGKSTLLKVLSRITEPTSGEVKIYGKVASLLEVGTGFHPELSGRENIFLNGAILGMPRSEIRRKFDQIVDFSGVEKFLDTPVKHYSSGMYVRLAFSVSAWLDPDILIVDEVLSVGDQAFQKKCAGRMKELTGDGRTVIFVSHSMAAVKSMCEKALFLKNGEVVSYGPVEEGTTQYTRSIMEGADQYQWHRDRFVFKDGETESYTDALSAVGYAECIEGKLELESGTNAAFIAINESFKIHLKYRLLKDVPGRVVPNFHFFDESGGRFFVSYPEQPFLSSQGVYEAVCEIPPFLFNVGRFTVMPALSTYELKTPVHFALPDALRFEIEESEGVDTRRHGFNGILPGLTRPRLNWQLINSK